MQNHNSAPEETSAFESLSYSPIVCFSAFLKGISISKSFDVSNFSFQKITDLNRPMFLNHLNPSAEIVKTGVNFVDISEAIEEIPSELFNCTSFCPSKM